MVFAEYIVLVGVVVLSAGLALYGLVVPLLRAVQLTQLLILLPMP